MQLNGMRFGLGTALMFVAILAAAAALRFVGLGTTPPTVYNDDVVNGLDALRTLRSGELELFYPKNNGREPLFVWLLALTHLALPPSVTALKLPSAAIGTVSVALIVPATLALWRFFGRGDGPETEASQRFALTAALAAMLFLCASYWHIGFSRVGVRAALDPFFALLSIWLVIAALDRSRGPLLAILAGVAIGLGVYGYLGHKFLVLPLAGISLYALWRGGLHSLGRLALVAGVALIVASGFVYQLVARPDALTERLSQVSVFGGVTLDQPDRLITAIGKTLLNAVRLLVALIGPGDARPLYNISEAPHLSQAAAIALVIALTVAVLGLIRRLPRDATDLLPLDRFDRLGLFLLLWMLVMIVPAAMTWQGQPSAIRAIGMLPPLMILCGLGAAVMIQGIARLLEGRTGLRMLAAVTLAFAAFIQPWHSYVAYFHSQAHLRDDGYSFVADTNAAAYRFVADGDRHRKVILSRPCFNNCEFVIGHFLYLAEDDLAPYRGQHITAPEDLATHAGGDAILFVDKLVIERQDPDLTGFADVVVF
ncbi:MAG: hypothetical protein AAGG47_04910 [Pseudomonadota bacterium]